ncbi:MAG: NAD(P)H-dependent oxidoreductase [Chryseobacterium sp.]|nr:MAG: NAD(P)H-dependent oxidoreductase [Chryseobacterium sp.]
MKKKIAVLVGSLRKESYNRRIANELIRLAPETMELEIVEIGNLPHYNEDLEENPPKEWTDFREKIQGADGIFIVSPEYNRSMPGALKNAIDIGSRPPKENAWIKKPVAVATASGSGIGGFGANHAIRQSLVFSQIRLLPVELYIGNMKELFKEDGKTLVDDTQDFLKSVLSRFEDWIETFS